MAHCSNKGADPHPPVPVPPADALVTVVVELEVLLEFVVLLVASADVVVNCCFPPRSGSAGGSSVIRLLATTVAVVAGVELLPVVASGTGTPSAATAVAVANGTVLSDVSVAPASVAETGMRCCGLL